MVHKKLSPQSSILKSLVVAACLLTSTSQNVSQARGDKNLDSTEDTNFAIVGEASEGDAHAQVGVSFPKDPTAPVHVEASAGKTSVSADLPLPRRASWWSHAFKKGSAAVRTPRGNTFAYYGTYLGAVAGVTYLTIQYGKDYPAIPIILMFAISKIDEVLKSFSVQGTVTLQAAMAQLGFPPSPEWLLSYGSEARLKRAWQAMKATIQGDEQEIVDRLSILLTSFHSTMISVQDALIQKQPEVAASRLAAYLRHIHLSVFPYTFDPDLESSMSILLDPIPRELLEPIASRFFGRPLQRKFIDETCKRIQSDSEIPLPVREMMEKMIRRWFEAKSCKDLLIFPSDF